jgi:hypothetical protein
MVIVIGNAELKTNIIDSAAPAGLATGVAGISTSHETVGNSSYAGVVTPRRFGAARNQLVSFRIGLNISRVQSPLKKVRKCCATTRPEEEV